MNETTTHEMIMNSYFDFLYTKALYECIWNVVKQSCYGCEVEHPSQVHHACILYDTREGIEIFFNQLISTVKEDDNLLSWSEIVDHLKICPELLDLQLEKGS